jgi:hypothetical protein
MENEKISIRDMLSEILTKVKERQNIIKNEIIPELAEITALGHGFNLIVVKEDGCKLVGISSRTDDIAVMIAAVRNVLQQTKDKENFKALLLKIVDVPEKEEIEIDDLLNSPSK